MEFIINTKTFIEYVTPAADIALKNTVKHHSCVGLIKISTYPNILEIDAYGGSASITAKVRPSDGYKYGSMGDACIQAKELADALKSFPPTEDLVVCIGDGKLKICSMSDKYGYIKIPLVSNLMDRPQSPEKYDHKVTVDREYLVKGLQHVRYASANSELMFIYMCILFESTNNTIRFTAGSGARFATVEYIGNNKSISSGKAYMIFPKTNIPNIIRILKKISQSSLEIKTSLGDSTENIPPQHIIETDNITVRIYELELFTTYPDITTVTNYDYPYQILTKIQEWKYAAEAITASQYSCKKNVHTVKIMAELQNGHFDLQSNTSMQMNRIVHFESEACLTDTAKDKSYKPWFCCHAYYLIEMVDKNKKKNNVTINFEDQTILDKIPADKPKQMKPVLFKFPDEIDKNGVTEKSLVFTVISTKWDDAYLSEEQEDIPSRSEILDL